jgi:hypothetical protein
VVGEGIDGAGDDKLPAMTSPYGQWRRDLDDVLASLSWPQQAISSAGAVTGRLGALVGYRPTAVFGEGIADALSAEGVRIVDGDPGVVVIGDVLCTIDDVAALLEEAVGLLGQRGEVILATPLAGHPDPAHRRTFGITDLLALLGDGWAPEHVEVVDGWGIVVARAAPVHVAGLDPVPTQAVAALDAHVHVLATRIARLEGCEAQRAGDLAEAGRALSAARARIAELEAELEERRAKHAQARARAEEAEERRVDQRDAARRLRDDLETRQADLDRVRVSRDEVRAELAAIRATRWWRLRERAVRLRARLRR